MGLLDLKNNPELQRPIASLPTQGQGTGQPGSVQQSPSPEGFPSPFSLGNTQAPAEPPQQDPDEPADPLPEMDEVEAQYAETVLSEIKQWIGGEGAEDIVSRLSQGRPEEVAGQMAGEIVSTHVKMLEEQQRPPSPSILPSLVAEVTNDIYEVAAASGIRAPDGGVGDQEAQTESFFRGEDTFMAMNPEYNDQAALQQLQQQIDGGAFDQQQQAPAQAPAQVPQLPGGPQSGI